MATVDLDKLLAQLENPAAAVQQGDTRVEYRNMDNLLKAINYAKQEKNGEDAKTAGFSSRAALASWE